MHDNAVQHAERTQPGRGTPRAGAALLQGLATCGECGHVMRAVYKPGVRYICHGLAKEFAEPMCAHLDGPSAERLVVQASEIVIQFRSVPHRSFPADASSDWHTSKIIISIQPDECITLRFQAREPGPNVILKPADMRFNYREGFSGPFPEAYETLLWDIMQNDATEFMRADQIEASWQILKPVLEACAEKKPADFPNYAPGSMGPAAADELLERHAHSWGEFPHTHFKKENSKYQKDGSEGTGSSGALRYRSVVH
jgi:hypothetical protein